VRTLILCNQHLFRQGAQTRPQRFCVPCMCRLGSAADAFLLKIAIEERLGYPVQFVSDGLVRSIESTLNLTGPASVYAALAAGAVDIYPEVRRAASRSHASVHVCKWMWGSELARSVDRGGRESATIDGV
jgi:hypothetical protein